MAGMKTKLVIGLAALCVLVLIGIGVAVSESNHARYERELNRDANQYLQEIIDRDKAGR